MDATDHGFVMCIKLYYIDSQHAQHYYVYSLPEGIILYARLEIYTYTKYASHSKCKMARTLAAKRMLQLLGESKGFDSVMNCVSAYMRRKI